MGVNIAEISRIIRQQMEDVSRSVDTAEVGTVLATGDGIARVYGLDKCMAGELLDFPHDVKGMVLNLEDDNIGVALLGEAVKIKEGDTVRRTGRIVEVPVGEALLGRVVNALGAPLDGLGELKGAKMRRVELKAPGIVYRQGVKEPLQTGL